MRKPARHRGDCGVMAHTMVAAGGLGDRAAPFVVTPRRPSGPRASGITGAERIVTSAGAFLTVGQKVKPEALKAR